MWTIEYLQIAIVFVSTINLPDAVMLHRAYSGGEVSPVGLEGHVITIQHDTLRKFLTCAEELTDNQINLPHRTS